MKKVACSLISYRGRSQNFQSLNLLHLFVALKGIRLKSFPYEMRDIFCIVVYGAMPMHRI